MPFIKQSMLWRVLRDNNFLTMSQTGYCPFDAHEYEFKKKELSIMSVEIQRSIVIRVIRELEALSLKKDLKKPVYALSSGP